MRTALHQVGLRRKWIMGRKTVGWAWAGSVAFPLLLLLGGCGSSSNAVGHGGGNAGGADARAGGAGFDANTSGGRSSGGRSAIGVGGASGLGGRSGTGGMGGMSVPGGSSNGGDAGQPIAAAGTSGNGSGGASGGAQTCVLGADCKCGALTGVIECPASGPTCVCPPADECKSEEAPKCFEPCGGQPFGGWVLESSCFAAGSFSKGVCQTATQATPGLSDLRMRILDGGQLDIFVQEDWTTQTRISPACSSLYSTTLCPTAFYSPDALLFSSMPRASCTASPCGACDCTSTSLPPGDGFSRTVGSPDLWAVAGPTTLSLAGRYVVPYCVVGNELWIGGKSPNGPPQVAYKFKKQSCAGAPMACANRSPAVCESGPGCTLGKCQADVPANAAHCAPATYPAACSVLQGCTWAPDACYGDTSSECDFISCGKEPGCNWGPPVEKCGGSPSCDGLSAADCPTFGCNLTKCSSNDGLDVDCSQLKSTADCAKAPGCVSHPGAVAPCTGTTQCFRQSDLPTCGKLGCVNVGETYCGGEPISCNQLSTADCHKLPGCRIEW